MDESFAEACPAYILAGGQSSRFGSDKALVNVGGESLLTRLERSLRVTHHPTYIVADSCARYAHLGYACLMDCRPGCGPLAGLETAMQHRREQYGDGWTLLLAADQLLWKPTWLIQLLKLIAGVPECQAACFRDADHWQPIPGLYHSGMLDQVRHCLDARQLSFQNLLRQVPSVTMHVDDNPRKWSFNTPGELDALRNLMSGTV